MDIGDILEVGDVPFQSSLVEEPVPQSQLGPSSFGEKAIPEFDEKDYRSHRNVYVALHVPYSKPRHHKSRHKKRHRRAHSDQQLADVPEQRAVTPELTTQRSLPAEPKTPQDPCDRVKFILGSEEVCDGNHPETNPTHTIFTELEELKYDEHDQKMEWKETARWIKFEEDVEEGGNKWSKPHVATLSLHSLFELRSCLLKGTVLLDMQAENLAQISDYVLDDLVSTGELETKNREKVRDALLQRHKHLCTKDHHESGLFGHIRSLGEIGRHNSAPRNMDNASEGHSSSLNFFPLSVPNLSMFGGRMSRRNSTNPTPQEVSSARGSRQSIHLEEEEQQDGNGNAEDGNGSGDENGNGNRHRNGNGNGHSDSDPDLNIAPKPDSHLLKKLPPGSEASNVLVGEVDFLQHPIIAFVRLSEGQHLGDLTEVPIPTRFLFILLGPQGNQERYHEIGRSIATLMSDEVFHDVAYKARNRGDLLAGIDEFLDKVTVLPPGEWDPQIRLSPPDKVPSQVDRRITAPPHKSKEHKDDFSSTPPIKWAKTPCIGLIEDATRCYNLYWSDIRDAFSLQMVASVIFLYIASITVAITFGNLLSDITNQTLGTTEMLLAVGIGNFIFALFSGQPLVILGSTGPTLMFEQTLFDFCKEYDIPYLNFRFWIGLWTAIFMIILAITNASAIMRLFTRFTEEIFATLVSTFFTYFALESLWNIHKSHPYNRWLLFNTIPRNCLCYHFNNSIISSDLTNATVIGSYWEDSELGCTAANSSILLGDGCPDQYQPDVFFLSVILFAGTILLAVFITRIRKSRIFNSFVRRFVSDFAVFFSVVVWVCVDVLARVNTPKLSVPNVFQQSIFTQQNRTSIFVNPLGDNIPVWAIPAAILPAILATILLFIDQHITALIVNRRDHKLKKGPGYHLDLLIVGILIFINSAFGLPWIVGATVLSVTHVQSLFLYSPCTAPGERPKFLGVREQRVTLFITSVLLGLSILAYKALQLLPLPVLYGLLLYIGVASLYDVQFLKRIKLFFISHKNKPDCDYFRHIPNWRIHLYTVIQIIFWVLLCIFKFAPRIDVVFPLAVLLLVVGRWFLGFVFCKRDLELLDDPIPDKLYCKRFRYVKCDDNNTKTSRAPEEGKVEAEDMIDGLVNEEEEDITHLAVRNPAYKRTSSINMTQEVDQCDLWRTMPLVRNLEAPPASPCKRVPQNINNKQRVSCPGVIVTDTERERLEMNGRPHQHLGARRSLFQSTAV